MSGKVLTLPDIFPGLSNKIILTSVDKPQYNIETIT